MMIIQGYALYIIFNSNNYTKGDSPSLVAHVLGVELLNYTA